MTAGPSGHGGRIATKMRPNITPLSCEVFQRLGHTGVGRVSEPVQLELENLDAIVLRVESEGGTRCEVRVQPDLEVRVSYARPSTRRRGVSG